MSANVLCCEATATANWPFTMYATLSDGAVRTIGRWASEALKDQYLPSLCTGAWSGTMCLTEPQCGTDLSQVRTRAEPAGDGTYRLTGTKIFISAGDSDLTENVIHVVLARLPGSDPSTKGLSLFLVPRHVVQPDGSLAAEKNVKCIAIEKKMGIQSSATCQLAFEASVGYLIGEESSGMKQMFTFMNGARIGTALQGITHAEMAFQNGLRYARERGSQRALSGVKCPAKTQDAIVHHANVRHNLLFAKAVAEGGRALLVEMCRLLDLHDAQTDPAKARALDDEIGVYTPIAKGCLTEWAVEAAYRCQQVWGGHGYIRGNGMELIARDARIATLYEGTTGIQALDFIGRKMLSRRGGTAQAVLHRRVQSVVGPLLLRRGALGRHARQLWLTRLQWRIGLLQIGLNARRDRDSVSASCEEFLFYSGYMMLACYWLRMAVAAEKKVAAGQDADGFYQAKLDTCAFVFDRLLPRTRSHYDVMVSRNNLCASKHETWDLN
ncbi:acyl-CoA dehydrogenase [Strigomonas culicis]|uniref:Acyl-CoA dehydrogenase n=1 Tax=Strigomonas culicis TaxID=28005 RepID=S9UV79_9TRYP|nr:acyl-CoA dehydrogenase [Strigomonas culicis]|eukprot:EPY32664.1 acyl-CoA dehydrogenase [Strigomonas culicis]